MFKRKILLLTTAILMASLILSGCSGTSTSTALQISDIKGIQDGDQVTVGTAVLLFVDASGSGQLSYTWEDANGTLQSDNRSSLNYVIPNNPGQTFIKVTVRTGSGDEKTKQVRYTIIASTAGTNTPVVIAAATPTNTPVTPTAVNTETSTPTTAPVSLPCFDSHVWTPYEPSSNIQSANDCWDLSPWGLRDGSGTISIQPTFDLKAGQSHGIYRSIPTNCEISFDITVNKFTVLQSLSGNISVGIINMEPIGPATSRLLYYHYIYALGNIPIQTGVDGQYANLLSMALDFSKPEHVVMILDGPQLVISIDGQGIPSMNLPLEKRAFYISYAIPEGSQLDAAISNLVIH